MTVIVALQYLCGTIIILIPFALLIGWYVDTRMSPTPRWWTRLVAWDTERLGRYHRQRIAKTTWRPNMPDVRFITFGKMLDLAIANDMPLADMVDYCGTKEFLPITQNEAMRLAVFYPYPWQEIYQEFGGSR